MKTYNLRLAGSENEYRFILLQAYEPSPFCEFRKRAQGKIRVVIRVVSKSLSRLFLKYSLNLHGERHKVRLGELDSCKQDNHWPQKHKLLARMYIKLT